MNGHGIAFALAGTAAYNAGFVLEKRALLSLPALDLRHPKHLVRTLFTAPGWLVGFACMGIGLACQVGALFTLPLSVAQPLQSGGVVVLALLSWLVLGERTGPRDRRRIALIVLALILLGLSVDDHGPANMPADPATMIITVVVSAACAIALWQAAGGARVTGPVAAGIATGLFYGIAGLGMKGLSAHLAGEGVAAAPASPYGYLLVAASVCGMAVFQTSLQRFRATALVPTANVSGSGYVILVGSLLFHESLPREPLPLALRVT
ncbi:hypothetical protein FPZ12_042675, partial [Amycolatopsis acidicola]